MGGLLVLALIGLYLWAAHKLVRRTPPIWGKALIVIAAILIPTADAVYGRYKLKEMCAADGGLRINRVVEGVAGFDDPRDVPREESIKSDGYKFVEGEEIGGQRSRLSLGADGAVHREVGVTPVSEYIYELDKGDFREIYHRTESRIRVRSTGEILSQAVNIRYAGGWFERFVNGIYAGTGTAGTCGSFIPRTELVSKTLKPIK